MNKRLVKAFARAETDRKAILELLKHVPDETLMAQSNGKWSASEIISHLILSEMLSLQYMKKKSLGIVESGSTGLWAELKYTLLIISQWLPLKYKAPKVLAQSRPELLPFNEMRLRWDTTRKELETFLENFDDRYLNKKVYKHPIAGRLNVLHALGLMKAHASHHLPQIKKRITSSHALSS